MIPPAFVQELLGRVDIVDVVGRHVALKKGGANLSGLCPFHAEKSPSFTVSPTKQFYHCFGCGANGDAIRFLTEYSAMTFVDAVHELAQQVGLTVPQERSGAPERELAAAQKELRERLIEVLVKAADAYRKHLKHSARAIEYLKGRGLSGEIAAQFGLGYAPDGWRSLASVFPSYDDPLLEQSGMVIAKEADAGADGDAGERKRYDRFRDRIMFPIRSVQGEVIGFGGRVLERAEPKYLNSPETPVFSKGRELYGLYEARAALRQRGYALVVEGYMDVVALAQCGFGNAVATLGTACTAEHLQKLLRFTDSVVFSFDGDAAGRRAARRALEASLVHASDTRTISFLFLPAEHDPDSFVRTQGAPAFEDCVQRAVPLSRQLIEVACEGCALDTAEGRAHMLANAQPLWRALPEGTLKRQLLADIALTARDDAQVLQAQWATPGASPLAAAAVRADVPASRSARRVAQRLPPRAAKGTVNLLDRAIWLLVRHSALWLELDNAAHDLFAAQPDPYDRLFGCIERSVHEHGPMAAQSLLDELRALGEAGESSDAAAATVARIARLHDPEPNADIGHELRLVVAKLRLQAVESELQALFDTGANSADALHRSRTLMEERSRLKR